MKQLICLLFCFSFSQLYAQNLSSTNSGAVSSNNLIYTVGEVFVIPISNPDKASSGTIGAVSRIEFFVIGVQEIISEKNVTVYPNPTNNSIFLETANEAVEEVFVYTISGQLVVNKPIVSNTVDLSELVNGTYIIKTNNPKLKSFKIIKQ